MMPTYLESKITLIAYTKTWWWTYLHQDRLAELLTVDDLYGDFLARYTVDSQFDQPCRKRKNTQQKQIIISAGGDNIKKMCSEDPWKATNTQIIKPVIVPNGDILCHIIYMKKAKLFLHDKYWLEQVKLLLAS